MTMGYSFWTAMLFVGTFCQTAPAEDIGCSIPSVKKGGNTTLTCSFPVSAVSVGTTVTVNGHLFAPSDKGPDLAVLSLEMTKEGWGQPIIHPRFKFRNISIADGKWRVFIDLSNATYRDEGVYICQLAGTPDHQECSFVLDRVKLTINNTSLLLHVDLHDVDDERKQHYLIKRVQHRTGQVLKNDTLPKPADNFTLKLKSDRKYKVAVYMGESHIPVTRSICIPTVRELQTTTMKSGGVRVDWKLGPVCNDHVAMSDKYRYQVCSQEADSVVPLQDNCFDSHIRAATISDLTVGSKCMYGVRVAFNSGGHGPLTTLEADILPYKPEADERSPWEYVGYVLLAIFLGAAVCGGLIVFAPKIYHCIVKRLKRKEGDGHIDEEGDLQTHLMAQIAAVGEPEPAPADMGDGPSLGQVAGHQNTRVEIPATDIIDGQPAGPTSGRVSGPENRPRDPDVEVMCPENLDLTAPGVDIAGGEELANDLSPDSGCDPEPEQEMEDIRTLRENYQKIERENNQQKTEIQDLKGKLQQMTDQLKEGPKHTERQKELDAMTNKCRELQESQDKFQKEKKEMEDAIAKLQKEIGVHEQNSQAMQDHIKSFKRWEENAIKDKNEQLKQHAKELEHRNEEIAYLKLEVENYKKQLQNLRLQKEKDPYLQKRNRDHGNRQHDEYMQGVQKDQADPEEEDKCMGFFKRPNNPIVGNGGRLVMGAAASDMQPSTSGKQSSVSKLSEDNKLLGTESMGAAARSGTTKESSPPFHRQTSIPVSDSPDVNIIRPPTVADFAGPHGSVESEEASGFQTSAEEHRPSEVNPSSTAAFTHQLSSSAGQSVHPGT